MWIEIIVGVLIPCSVGVIGLIRYFWKKEQCFIALKNKIVELSEQDKNSIGIHTSHEEDIRDIQEKQYKTDIYLKLILDKLEIPYNE